MPHAGRECGLHNALRAEDVVAQRFEHVLLHERHVFMRGGMEDCGGRIALHHGGHRGTIPNIDDDGHCVEASKTAA